MTKDPHSIIRLIGFEPAEKRPKPRRRRKRRAVSTESLEKTYYFECAVCGKTFKRLVEIAKHALECEGRKGNDEK